jgi:hypothetical protein
MASFQKFLNVAFTSILSFDAPVMYAVERQLLNKPENSYSLLVLVFVWRYGGKPQNPVNSQMEFTSRLQVLTVFCAPTDSIRSSELRYVDFVDASQYCPVLMPSCNGRDWFPIKDMLPRVPDFRHLVNSVAVQGNLQFVLSVVVTSVNSSRAVLMAFRTQFVSMVSAITVPMLFFRSNELEEVGGTDVMHVRVIVKLTFPPSSLSWNDQFLC